MIDIWILGLAFFFWLAETRYFGWNMHAESAEELICDGIVMVLIAMAFLARRARAIVT